MKLINFVWFAKEINIGKNIFIEMIILLFYIAK